MAELNAQFCSQSVFATLYKHHAPKVQTKYLIHTFYKSDVDMNMHFFCVFLVSNKRNEAQRHRTAHMVVCCTVTRKQLFYDDGISF